MGISWDDEEIATALHSVKNDKKKDKNSNEDEEEEENSKQRMGDAGRDNLKMVPYVRETPVITTKMKSPTVSRV